MACVYIDIHRPCKKLSRSKMHWVLCSLQNSKNTENTGLYIRWLVVICVRANWTVCAEVRR